MGFHAVCEVMSEEASTCRTGSEVTVNLKGGDHDENYSLRVHNTNQGSCYVIPGKIVAPYITSSKEPLSCASGVVTPSHVSKCPEPTDLAAKSLAALRLGESRSDAASRSVDNGHEGSSSDSHKAPEVLLSASFHARSSSPAPSVASVQSCNSAHTAGSSRGPPSSPRERFLVFIKILFKCLDDEPLLRNKAKKIVQECTLKNRRGDPEFTPLMEAVEKRLRGFVGETHWRKALLLLRHWMAKRAAAAALPSSGAGVR